MTDWKRLDDAIYKVLWACGDTGINHPTHCSQYWRSPNQPEPVCDCGLWEALEYVSKSKFGMLLREWEQGRKPR